MSDKYEILKTFDEALEHVEDIIGANETNNQQLERLCRRLFGCDFLGVFPANKWPKLILNNQMFIINNKSDRSPGEHWIACVKYNNRMYAFDSFGRNVHKLSPYWKNKVIINANHERLQSYKELNCGARAIAFLVTFKKI